MTLDQIRRLHQKRPFESFDIYVADGRAVRVNHPENLTFFGKGRTFSLVDGEEYEEVFDLLMVTSLRPIKASQTHDNGQ